MPSSLADKYNLTPEEVLKIIEDNPRCEQMVKGFVAEYHLEKILKVLKSKGIILDFHGPVKDKDPDFTLVTKNGTLLMECKMFRSNKKGYEVDFQKTRNAQDDKLSRFYRRSSFDILAACTYNKNERWDFRFIRTKDLPLDVSAGEDCLKKVVRCEEGDCRWSDSLENLLISDTSSAESGSTIVSPPLSSTLQTSPNNVVQQGFSS
ncbi:hypothetical protein [Methanomassiliicoccus luminyensis]|jgi:hypothetical protein|uniref:hypothetical protein n=1 Tax=Methanomassiliicoccus luminyensis TaxID=1080712 RepID=UPI00036B5335|nr:hypothetical protein [Methanomassiliicoccus luminyensis]